MERTSVQEMISAMRKDLRDYNLLLSKLSLVSTSSSQDIINFQECCQLTGLSASTLYKKTALRLIPHFKEGKRVLFRRKQILDWLTRDYRQTLEEIEVEADRIIK